MTEKSKVIKLSDADLSFWRTEIKQARAKREEVSTSYDWEGNLKRYVPKPKTAGKDSHEVNIGADFRDVERKKAALFYDTPQVSLVVTQDREVSPASPEQPKALQLSTLSLWHQELLNGLLGPRHANIKPVVLEAIFDCLCPAGVGPVSVGYQVTMRTVDQEVPVIGDDGQVAMDPLSVAASLLGMGEPMPIMETVQVEEPIDERWFVSRFSPKALLVPASFKSTDFQRAPWLGHDWRKPLSQVRREYHLPKDWTAGGDADDVKVTFDDPAAPNPDEDTAGDPYITGCDLYYRAALRSDKETHPDLLRQLVMIDGKEQPVVHRNSPYQDFGEDGTLSVGSLKGFTVRPLVLRSLSDSAWIPSDCAVTGALTKELNKYRTQIVEQRNTNHNVILFDASKIDPSAKDKIVQGPGGDWVPVQEGALAGGKDAIMAQAAQVSLGRENYMGQDIIERDREQILGIGANQSGVATKGRRTATENSIVQRNSEARFEQERQKVLEWFLDVVAAFDALVLRYADQRVASQILGDVRGQIWAMHKQALAGGYSYNLRVDSGKYLDIEADRRQVLQFYNQVRQDPFVNPRPILNDIAEKFGYDPAEFITEPPKPPKELKASFSFKAEDLNPMAPQFALVVKLMRQAGWDVNEQDVQLAQGQAQGLTEGLVPVSGVGPDPNAPQPPPGHPGAMGKAPTIDQHQMDETGQRTGPRVDL